MRHSRIFLRENGQKSVGHMLMRETCHIPAVNYMFKVNNKNTRTKCEICSKLTIDTSRRSGVFIVNFEHVSHLFLVFLLLTLNM